MYNFYLHFHHFVIMNDDSMHTSLTLRNVVINDDKPFCYIHVNKQDSECKYADFKKKFNMSIIMLQKIKSDQ